MSTDLNTLQTPFVFQYIVLTQRVSVIMRRMLMAVRENVVEIAKVVAGDQYREAVQELREVYRTARLSENKMDSE